MAASKPSKSNKTPARATSKKKQIKLSFPVQDGQAAVKKQPRNGNILSYFKKADREEDESLFVENISRDDDVPDELGEPDDSEHVKSSEENIYDADPWPARSRFNEHETTVKKRKLDSGEDARPEGSVDVKKEETKVVPPPKRKRSHPNNPFLSDSSDDDDDDNNDDDALAQPTNKIEGKSAAQTSTMAAKPSIPTLLKTETFAPHVNHGTSREIQQDTGDVEDSGEFIDTNSLFDDTGDQDDEFAGEEFRERQYMHEQARLEAEESGNYNPAEDDFVAADDGTVECCPICDGSLAGVTVDQATAHVNACLDGKPTPLPATVASKPSDGQVDGQEFSKRFVRAAVPRAGQANPFNLDGVSVAPDKGSAPDTAFSVLMSGHAENAAWQTAAAAEHASRGQPAYKRTCPFYKIMPGFSICVDAFRYGAVEGCQAYFLSHFHSDHYIGLTARWTHGPIYCSKVTGSLVKSQLRTAAQYVVELDFEVKTAVPRTDGVFVTMVPANHCPGSSLFLFEKVVAGGKTKRILHCGDFRACPAHIAHPALRPDTVDVVTRKVKQQKIDVCYLDTTYLNPRYSFPPQEDVIKACADVCKSLNDGLAVQSEKEWQALLRRREGGSPAGIESVSKFFAADNTRAGSGPAIPTTALPPALDAFSALKAGQAAGASRLLVVCGTYSIGKERICKAIAQALGTKIFASPAKIRMVRQLGDPELSALMTADPRAAQVHMQMLMEIRAETLADYLNGYRPHFGRVVGFRPSGWNYRPTSTTGGATGPGTVGSGKVVSANLAPGSVATTQLLHGGAWRTRFSAAHLSPQRGSGRDAMCFGVPYSEHSSFRELALFVMALRIDRVVPTVNVGSDVSRKRMKAWTDRWMAERARGGLVAVLEGDEGDAAEVELWDGKHQNGGGVYW